MNEVEVNDLEDVGTESDDNSEDMNFNYDNALYITFEDSCE